MIAVIDSLLCLACLWFARSEVSRVRARVMPSPLYPILWLLLALVLGLLALQQATGMLGAITDAARMDAKVEGWYGDRRPFQWLLVRAVPVAALLVGVGASWIIRRAWPRYLLVLAAMLYLVSFAAIQGISFHNIDWLLRQRSAGLQNKIWGSLIGLALTTAALWVVWRRDGDARALSVQGALGRLRRIGGTAGRSLQAEGRIFVDWYGRYRAARRRHRPRVSPRRK